MSWYRLLSSICNSSLSNLETDFVIDLVIYHRILKCHILVEPKTKTAKHAHIGQLKSYLNYYKKNFQESDDNLLAGILLVTSQNIPLSEYAMA